jgi:glycogen(starch) synthase
MATGDQRLAPADGHVHCSLPLVPRRRLRVLHAAPYLWSGAGSVITRLIESQVARHEVGLITSPASGELQNWATYDRRVAKSGARRRRIDLFHRDSESLWTAVEQMRQAIDEIEPDILHTHAGTPTAVAVLARSRSSHAGIPLVSHFYSWGLGRPEWMNDMDLWAFSQADSVICSAHAYRDVLKRGGVPVRRLRLVPWGISMPDDMAPRGERNVEPVIGTLGRIERRKGQLDLVNAFARLRRWWPEARLEIVGPVAEESYASSIRAAIGRHRLDDAVRLTGHVADPQELLARWSAYVSLSTDEGQGLAVLEAMANGVPVVALGVAGIEDYLADERTGLIARSRRDTHVATVVDRVIRDGALARRLVAKARVMVRRRFSWTRTLADIGAVYHELREERR